MPKTSCRAKNREGKPCQAAAGGGGLCHLHANPDFAKTLGRQGGRKNRHFTGVDVEVPPNMNASDLNALGSRTIGLVLSGALQAREAGAVAQLINAQARIIPLLDFEKRIADLERQAARVLERQQAEPQQAESQQSREVPIDHDGKDERSSEIAIEPFTQTEVQANGDNSKAIAPGVVPDTANEHGTERDTDQVTPSEAQSDADADSSEEN